MSQESQPPDRKGKRNNPSMEDPAYYNAVASSFACFPSASLSGSPWPSSIQSAPFPSTGDGGAPVYSPLSRDYVKPPSRMQSAWAAAPMPATFVNLIAQTVAISKHAYATPDSYEFSGSAAIPPATVHFNSWPADLNDSSRQIFLLGYESPAPATPGQLHQPYGPHVPFGVSDTPFSPTRSAQPVGLGLYASSPTAPVVAASQRRGQGLGLVVSHRAYTGTVSTDSSNLHPGISSFASGSGESFSPSHSIRPVQPTTPHTSSENSIGTYSSGKSTPHLGTGLCFPGLSVAALHTHPGQLAEPAQRDFNHQAAPSPSHTTPHLGTGLFRPSDAHTAAPMEHLQHPAQPVQPAHAPACHAPGYYGPQDPGSRGHASRRFRDYTSLTDTHFARDPRDTFQYAPQPQTQYIGFSPLEPGGYAENTTFGPQLMQYVQPRTAQGTDVIPYRGQRLPSPSPESATSAGSKGSAASIPRPFEERETYAREPDGRTVALANLQYAERQFDLASLRLQVRQVQSNRAEGKLQREKEKKEKKEKQVVEQDGRRLEGHHRAQWRDAERRDARRSRDW